MIIFNTVRTTVIIISYYYYYDYQYFYYNCVYCNKKVRSSNIFMLRDQNRNKALSLFCISLSIFRNYFTTKTLQQKLSFLPGLNTYNNFKRLSFVLTHLFPVHPFSTPWKHKKTLRFSDVFRGWREGTLGTNGLINLLIKHKLFLGLLFI